MRKTGKLLYVPGIISLVGILILLPSFYKRNMPVQEFCLPLFALPDSNKYDWIIMPLKYDVEKYVNKKKKIKFEFDENKTENYKKLEIIRYEALKLKYTLDTSTVILLTLSDSISYGEFISIIDMCEADGHKRYACWDNKFVIFGEWPKRKSTETDTIPLLYCISGSYKPFKKPAFFDIVVREIKDNYTRQGLYLMIGFVAILISLYFSRKKTIAN